jgi:hypothetical protein
MMPWRLLMGSPGCKAWKGSFLYLSPNRGGLAGDKGVHKISIFSFTLINAIVEQVAGGGGF